MADLTEIESSGSTKVVGSDSDSNETSSVGASSNNELFIRDTHDNGGLDVVLNITTTPSEGKVGATTKTLRKYALMQALDKNIVWGFSNSSQSFDLFKSQLIMIPVGENTEIWFKTTVGTGQVAFGELS